MASFPFWWAKCALIATIAPAAAGFHPSSCTPSTTAPITIPQKIASSSSSALSSSSFSGGFDSDRMDALTQRGELEASLMMQSFTGVLGEDAPNHHHHKKKTKTTNKTKEKKKKAPSAAIAARTLGQEGVVKLDGILSSHTASVLRHEILERRDAALASISDNDDNNWRQYFADVLLKGNQHQGQRYDLLLPLSHNPTLQTALHELLVSSNLLYNTLVNALGGEDIALYELSSLISEPGSPRQPVHPDNPHQEFAPLLTVFVALQDITPEMGPTNFIPRSNTAEAHAIFNDVPRRDDLLRTSPNIIALLRSGDASLFDSRTLHCGGSNDREEGDTRVLMYMSFRNPRATEPIGNVGSMMPGIEQMTISELRTKLVAAEKSRGDAIKRNKDNGDDGNISFVAIDPFDDKHAAEQGDALAQLKLGNRYYLGEGSLESNPEEAVRWFQLASDQGLAQASFNLGVCYFEGRGVPQQNLNRSLELFTIAAKGRHPGAKEACDEVMGLLMESGRSELQL